MSCARAPRRCGQSGVSDVCPAPTGSAPRPGRSPPADRLRDGGWPSCAVCRAAADGPTTSREAPTRAQLNRARDGATPVSPVSSALPWHCSERCSGVSFYVAVRRGHPTLPLVASALTQRRGSRRCAPAGLRPVSAGAAGRAWRAIEPLFRELPAAVRRPGPRSRRPLRRLRAGPAHLPSAFRHWRHKGSRTAADRASSERPPVAAFGRHLTLPVLASRTSPRLAGV